MLDCNLNGERVYAWTVEDREADYRCPVCGASVRLRRGNKKIPHFAHITDEGCSYGEGISEDHLTVQKEIAEVLIKEGIQCELEYKGVENRRADVFSVFENQKIVFEIQHSRIEPQTVLERTQDYNRAGCSVMWVMTPYYFSKFGGLYKTDKIRLSSWQRYILTLFEVVYVWNKGKLYAFDFSEAWGEEMVFQYGKFTGYNDVQLKESFDKEGIAEIDLLTGLHNGTLCSFESDMKPHVKLFGLDPGCALPADWKRPRTELEWNDPLR